MEDLLLEYMGECKKASQNWPARLASWIEDVAGARIN